MARIKTALEIALEKTNSVKSDKSSINQYEAKQQGKKYAYEYLESNEANIADIIKKCPVETRESLKNGIFDALVSQIVLPGTETEQKRVDNACKGLVLLVNNNKFSAFYKQLIQILGQYLQEIAQFEEAIKRQYAPKLRQKEEELSKRLGRQVHIDPFQDPEFTAFYSQNMNALKSNYQEVIEQFREEAKRMFISGD